MQNRCRGNIGESNANLTLDSCESSGDLCDSQNLNADDFGILVAKCGKTIGLKGEIRLIVYSDFDEIFTKGNVFLARDLAYDSSLRGSEATEAIQKSKKNDFALQNLAMTNQRILRHCVGKSQIRTKQSKVGKK